MNELHVFENSTFGQVRVVERNGDPWFVAADVCKALDIRNGRDALARLDGDEKDDVGLTDTIGRTQCMNIVNEPGLYTLVLGSRKPGAHTFKRWITHEVIPSIRKHGGYLTPEKVEEALLNPDTLIQLAQNLKEERAKRKELEAQKEADAPKVLFAKSVECSTSEILVGELAKILKQNGFPVGQNRLFERLRQDGYLIKNGADRNMPTQRSMELGVMRIKESTVNNPDGSVRVTKTPKITGKGQIYFVNKYAEKAVQFSSKKERS